MKEYRIEKDYLGGRKIPSDAYYGINAVRGRENFNISADKLDPVLIKSMAMVKKACAIANCDSGSNDCSGGDGHSGGLAKGIALVISEACDRIIGGGYNDQFIVNPIQGGGGTSINMNANEVIANLALEILGQNKGEYEIIGPLKHVNMSQSTNDVFPTAVNLTLLSKLKRLLKAIDDAESILLAKSREFDSVIKMGRTHLNAAQPISFGQCFNACALMVTRDRVRIKAAANILRYVPFGGTIVGTGLGASPEYRKSAIEHLRKISGENVRLCSNLADGIQNADVYAALSSALKVCMLNLSKIASDLRLLGSEPQYGLGELQLPPRQIGSSFMPEKVNPVMPELINQVAFMVCGYDLTVSMAAQSGQLELNVFKPVIAYSLFKSIDMMTEAIELFNKYCLTDIKIGKALQPQDAVV